MGLDPRRMLRGALAGGIAAGAWALQQPLDKRVLHCDYDDVELLGRAVLPRADRARWYPVGLLLHVQNGAMFGAVYAGALGPLLARGGVPRVLGAPLVAQVENYGLWPLGRLSDRFHPARNDLPRLAGNRRALVQATWRHMLFGIVLGELERRLNQEPQRRRSTLREAHERPGSKAGALPCRARWGWRTRQPGSAGARRG